MASSLGLSRWPLRIMRTLKILVMAVIASVVGCSTQPARQSQLVCGGSLTTERRSTEAEIRLHIVGEWEVADGSDGCLSPRLIIAEDGSLIGVQTNGKRELIGSWEMSHTLLRVTPTAARFETARKSGYHLNSWDYFPVIYADEHELVMTPGISVAGRWRYKR